MGRTPPGRSRVGWIAAVAALALLAALAATCEPAAEVRGPEDAGVRPSRKPATRRKPSPRATPEVGTPDGPDVGGFSYFEFVGSDLCSPNPPAAEERTARGPTVTVRRVPGKVVDSATDAPVASARIVLGVFDGSSAIPRMAWGDVTRDDGSFDVGPREGESHSGSRIEVIVVSPSHHLARAPAEKDVVLRVEPRPAPEPFGAIAGTVTTAGGVPVPGIRQLACTDAAGDWHGTWTVVAADGTFRVEGFAPGNWAVEATDGGPRVECIVPPGGTAQVALTPPKDDRPQGLMSENELRSGRWPEQRAVLERLEALRGKSPLTEDERDEIARLDAQIRATSWEEFTRRAVRPVRIEGLPAETSVVRLRRPGTRQTWSARAWAGVAEFPAVFSDRWDLEVERPGERTASRGVNVPSGVEPLVIRWDAAD